MLRCCVVKYIERRKAFQFRTPTRLLIAGPSGVRMWQDHVYHSPAFGQCRLVQQNA